MKCVETNGYDRKKAKYSENTELQSVTPKTIVEGKLGIIESVTVQNFMCHENYKLDFKPHMNFMIGVNGSGKSAILTAIMLALGGRSSHTDRFTSVKGFVKSGKNKAKIEVVLRNQGILPYKPETYGDKITVIREFNKEGVSSYKIKSESGTICASSRKVLYDILEAMDITVESPVCILTQATSKRFLISKDAREEKLFEFFYKSTGLEHLEKMYSGLLLETTEGKEELERKKQVIPDLKKELKKWEKYCDSSQKIHEYKNELTWAGVIKMEKEVQQITEENMKAEEEFKEHKKIMEGCKKSFAEKNSELDELKKLKSNSLAEMEEYRKRLAELNVLYENHSSSYRRNKGTLQKLENDKKKLEEDISCLEKCINDQKKEDEKNLEEEDRKRQKAVQDLKIKNSHLEDILKDLKGKIHTNRNEQNDLERVMKDLSNEVMQHQNQLRNLESNLVALRNAIRNKVNAFGEHTENVLWDIKNPQNIFKKPPIGPLGIYLEVKDPRWAAAIEYATSSSLLNSFYVDNYQDSVLLRKILSTYYQKPPSIIVSPYESQMYDVQDGKLQSSFPTILDMLEIKNYLVANCLIDQAMIERKLLVEDEKMGVSLMNNPPQNCPSASAYFMNCDQICFNPSRMYSFGKRKARSRLSVIRQEDLGNLEKDKADKVLKINEINGRIRTMMKAKESLPEKIENHERELVKVSTEIRKNLMEIKELERKEETKNVDCLLEELQTFYESDKEKTDEIRRYIHLISECESERLDLQGQKKNQSSILQSLERDYNNLDAKIVEVSKLIESFASGKRKYQLELNCKENKSKGLQKKLEEMKSKLEISRSNAEDLCPRINTERNYEEICRLISETEKVVQEKSNCDLNSLHTKYKEKQANLVRAEAEYLRNMNQLTLIGNMLKKREANFIKILKNTQLVISLTFSTILGGNGYNGNLKFDQHVRKLTLKVSTRANDGNRKNHSSLSGGERSFVTIAFLLALWERTRMPFRILDEYDVFMDSSNRQLCLDLLCRKAEEMADSQFILLSPLELPRMPKSDFVHILKMPSPKRKAEDENSPQKKHKLL